MNPFEKIRKILGTAEDFSPLNFANAVEDPHNLEGKSAVRVKALKSGVMLRFELVFPNGDEEFLQCKRATEDFWKAKPKLIHTRVGGVEGADGGKSKTLEGYQGLDEYQTRSIKKIAADVGCSEAEFESAQTVAWGTMLKRYVES